MADRLTIRVGGMPLAVISEDPELDLAVPGPVRPFLADDPEPVVTVRATWGAVSERPRGERLFDSGSLWQAYRAEGLYSFRFRAKAEEAAPYKEAVFTEDFSEGRVVLDREALGGRGPVYPLEYPLDELLAVAILSRGSGVELHACGVVDGSGAGHLFVGQSGAGKTTVAQLWRGRPGATVLSDDRIIVRRSDGEFSMYGTPWHGEGGFAEPGGAPVSRIHFLRHGKRNELVSHGIAVTVGWLFAASFPPFFSPQGMEFTLRFLDELAQAVRCFELRCVPGQELVSFLSGCAV